MLNKLKNLLGSDDTHSAALTLELASAALLLEIAYADHALHDDEIAAVKNKLKQFFSLDDTAVNELVDEAQRAHDDAVSLHPYVTLINEQCSAADKLKLLQALWQMAFADGELDRFEEHYIRKIAELLYVPHRGFIQAKRLAQEANEK